MLSKYFRLERVGEYMTALEYGATREAAAPLLGLLAVELAEILELGRQQAEKYGWEVLEAEETIKLGKGDPGRLYLYTLRCEARAEQALVRHFFAATTTSWKAAQTLLERRFPERWAAIKRTEAKVLEAAEEETVSWTELTRAAAKR